MTRPTLRLVRLGFTVLVAAGVGSCAGDPAGPVLPPRVEFSSTRVELGVEREATVRVVNTGEVAVGPVTLLPGAVRDEAGHSVPGARLVVTPVEIPTLNPGAGADVGLVVELPGSVQPGDYDASLEARIPDGGQSGLDVRLRVESASPPAEGGELVVDLAGAEVRQGDVVSLIARVRDADGAQLSGVAVSWQVIPPQAGYVTGNGQFVGFSLGDVQVSARAGSLADTVTVRVAARGLGGTLSLVGRGTETGRFSSDLWVHGDHAYVGTWGSRGGTGFGNTLNTWNVADPSAPVKTAALQVDARTVNDVKVRSDGALALITHEASYDARNGVSLLALDDPGRPRVVSRFTDGLESGVHNAWLEGDYAYLVVDGVDPAAGLHVLDVSNPAAPARVARFYGGTSFLHDVYVRDGLAFLSHWDAGLIILDVGNGVAGGSPTAPVEVSRIQTTGGQTHNAWYWPEARYVFVGEEDFATPGVMHVVDVRNLAEPREVATFRVFGDTPHNFWLDEARRVLYVAWYGNGLRALDVSGELLGELDRQGREFPPLLYDGSGACPGSLATCSWAPQLHRGHVFVADMNGGLRVVRHEP